jgi:hypothetical protein
VSQITALIETACQGENGAEGVPKIPFGADFGVAVRIFPPWTAAPNFSSTIEQIAA